MDSDANFPKPFLSKQDHKRSVFNTRGYSLVTTTAQPPETPTHTLHGETVAMNPDLFTTWLSDAF